jgi:hypothetical protein
LKWSCRAQKSTLDIEIVPMGDEAASRSVMAKPCGSVTNGTKHIVKVVDACTGSQKNVEKSLTGRAQRDDRRASADCSARAKSFVARQRQTMIGEPARTRRLQVQGNVDEFTQTSSGERA